MAKIALSCHFAHFVTRKRYLHLHDAALGTTAHGIPCVSAAPLPPPRPCVWRVPTTLWSTFLCLLSMVLLFSLGYFRILPSLIQSCRVVCAHSNIAIHARWIASESHPADAPSRQKWINACTTRAPVKKGSRQSPESRLLRSASIRQSRHALLVQDASEGGCSPPKDKVRSDASELRQEHRDLHDMVTFNSAVTTTRRRARVPPSGLLRPHIPARARVRHKSHAVVTTTSPTRAPT